MQNKVKIFKNFAKHIKKLHNIIMHLIKPISLVGIMGAGKTSFGKKRAKRLDLPFFDLDNQIKIKSGYSTKEIYTDFGETILKKTEFSIVKETLNISNAIISTGDGIADNYAAWEYLKANSIVVWLNLDLKLIAQRLKPNDDRPYLINEEEDMLQVVTKLYKKRAQQYKQAHIRIYEPNLSKKNFLLKLEKFQQTIEEKKLDITETHTTRSNILNSTFDQNNIMALNSAK
jgi:shikimate kinase